MGPFTGLRAKSPLYVQPSVFGGVVSRRSAFLRQFCLGASLITVAAILLLVTPPGAWVSWRPATCTSTGCFCEQVDVLAGIRQPINTWSSFAFAAAALIVTVLRRRNDNSGLTSGYSLIFWWSLMVIGLGSAFYHASLTFVGQFFDVFGMHLLGGFMLIYAIGRLRNWRRSKLLWVYWVLVAAFAAILILLPDTRRYLFALVIVAALAVEFAHFRRTASPPDLRWLIWGVAIMALAFGIWILDNTHLVCEPNNWLQGHAIWHIFGAVSTICLFRYYLSEKAYDDLTNRRNSLSSLLRRPVRRTAMIWIMLGTALAYILANAPLAYALRVHGFNGIATLWGWAPNQFLFLIVFFPLAVFSTLAALQGFVFRSAPTLHLTRPVSDVAKNWPASILVAALLAAAIGLIVYFQSAWSFDKLEPKYAQHAVVAMQQVNNDVLKSSAKPEEQEAFRGNLVSTSKADLEASSIPDPSDRKAVDGWLTSLTPGTYLQVIQNPSLQVRLGLLNPILHPLVVFQLFTVLLVGVITVALSALCFFVAKDVGYDGTNYPELGQTLLAVQYSVFFFGIYAICYNQYRAQIEYAVGSGSTVLQDVFVMALVVALLLALVTLDPGNRQWSFDAVAQYAPAALLVFGAGASAARPQIMRQVIGSETTPGIQAILVVCSLVLAALPILQLIPRQ